MRPLEITRSGLIGTVAVFIAIAVCVRLGVWQLDRRAERLAHNEAVEARLTGGLVGLSSPPRDTVGLTHRRAEAAGYYDNARSFVLGGRSLGGTPGVYVFTPLRLGAGAVLVNRGWLPSADAATVDLGSVAVDSAVSITGVLLALPETGVDAPPGNGFPSRWFRLDADAVRAQYPYPVSSLYLQPVSAEGQAVRAAMSPPTGAPIPLPGPVLDGGPHLSYAFQWFGFAAVFLVGWVALVMRRSGGGGRTRGPAAPDQGTSPRS